jgi:hypothetical protein
MSQEIYTDLEIKEFTAIGEDLRPESDFMGDWVFHYNPYTQLWNAIPRAIYQIYWSNIELSGVLRSKHLNTLLDLLHKCKGDVEMIKDITKSSDLI